MIDKMMSNIHMEYAGNSDEIIIVYSSDDKFAHVMGVSLVSVFENNQDASEIIVFILDDKISSLNKNKLISVFNKYNSKYHFIDVSQLIIPDFIISNRWPKSAIIRLYISNLLPNSVSRILYLDCDTIINQSLKELWNIDMDNKIIAGVNDCVGNGYKKNLGININSPYINSGVLLIDLNRFRRFDCEAKINSFMSKYGKVIRYPDQDIINGIFEGNILVLEPRYNAMTIFYDFTYMDMLKYRKPSFFYTRDQIEAALLKPSIIHFTSSFLSVRPWVKGSKHPQLSKYLRYKKLSPWSERELNKDNRGAITKIYSSLFRIMPSSLSIGFSGWLHANLLPWILAKRG